MTDKTTVSIPGKLKDKLKQKADETGFKSVQEYAVFILEQVLENEETSQTPIEPKEKTSEEDLLSEMEEKELKKSLAKLGYKV